MKLKWHFKISQKIQWFSLNLFWFVVYEIFKSVHILEHPAYTVLCLPFRSRTANNIIMQTLEFEHKLISGICVSIEVTTSFFCLHLQFSRNYGICKGEYLFFWSAHKVWEKSLASVAKFCLRPALEI